MGAIEVGHFTYRRAPSDGDLQQGDILTRTEELESILRQFHPYYLKEDYKYFLVLTQSCDLVLRNGCCEAPYLTLGAVRPFSLVIEREAARYQFKPLLKKANAIGLSSRRYLEAFLRRLLNNNHPEYFYLHEDPIAGLLDRSCAFLRLSVSIRASDHYKVAQRARIITLTPSFQAKLGWLVGNLYSRVGTEDWTPINHSEDEFKGIIDEILDQSVFWLDDRQIKACKLSEEEVAQLTPEEVRDRIKQTRKNNRKDELIDAVVAELGEFIDGGIADTVRKRLQNSQAIASIVR